MAHAAPEVTLLHKAFSDRAKNAADLERTWPRLDRGQWAWLRDAVTLAAPATGSWRAGRGQLPR